MPSEQQEPPGPHKNIMDRTGKFFFGRTFNLVSVKSINYTSTVKNDTSLIIVYMGVKVQMGFEPLVKCEVINKKL